MKAVLDTNVFISGIFWEGNFCSQIIEVWKEGKITLVTSSPIIEELIKVLKDFKVQMQDEEIKEWEKVIIENAVIVESSIKLDLIKDDPSDNKFIEAALTGKAKFLVSQDKHLLRLKQYENIKIVTPEDFLKLIN
ncbi:putative toxin-antitoxin system toxin component, PIN family [Candidatus Woesearchaeota archaeon]|nr:putative toxin-antitoxin system toxin component, PIN family [Candidatus Woesearchaeota archaeon]